jgi:hypothetical protein
VEDAREWGDMEVGFLIAWCDEESFRYVGRGLCVLRRFLRQACELEPYGGWNKLLPIS